MAQQLKTQGQEVALLAMFDTLNWYKLPPLTFWKKTRVNVERVIFHALNFLRLDSDGRSKFFGEKVQAVRNRIPVWRGMLLSKLAGNSEASGSRAVVLGQIWAGNDRASMDYIPKPYPGVVTDFRPLKQYGIYKRNDLKWEDLALGGQKLVQLQVYPAGMLLEPFVENLAKAVRTAMDAAIAGQTGKQATRDVPNCHKVRAFVPKFECVARIAPGSRDLRAQRSSRMD